MAQVAYEAAPTQEARIEAPDDLQHIEATPGEFGAQLGQAENQAGQSVIDATKFYGTVAADNGTNNTLQQVTSILHGDPSKQVMGPDGQMAPDVGFFGKRGADAMSAAPEVQAQIDEIIKENRESLSTPESKLQYDSDTRRYRAQWLNEIGTHTDQEQKTWATDTNKTSANLALNSVTRRPTDPTNVATQQEIVRKSYVRNAQLAGLDPHGALLQADQDVALARIRSLIVSDPMNAQKVLDSSADVLGSRPDYDQISRGVKEAVINHQLVPATNAAVAAAKMQASTLVGPPPTPGQPSAASITEDQASAAIQSAFPGATITSGARTPQHNAEVGGVPDSQHLSGNAVDFVLPKGTTFQQVKDTIAAHGLPASELIDEGTHIHWAWGAKGQQAGQTYPSTVDALRATEDQTLTQAQTDAVRMFPNYPDAQERYVDGVRRGIDQAITQQDQQYTIDTHIVQQALGGPHPPISEDELKAVSPQVAASWNSMQVNNPYAAMHIESIFDANARGAATNLGTQFYPILNRVLAPTGDPNRINNIAELWPIVQPGEDGTLTNTGAQALAEILGRRGTPQGDAAASQMRVFLNTAHQMISGSTASISNPQGEKRYQNFLKSALPQISAAYKSGNTAQLYDQKGDLYNSITNFMVPTQDMAKEYIYRTDVKPPDAVAGTLQTMNLKDPAIRQQAATQIKGLYAKYPQQAKALALQYGFIQPDAPPVPRPQ